MEMRGSGEGGCCIARYAHGNPNYYYYCSPYYDMPKMDRIMTRFRPIAPKPVVGGGPQVGPATDDVKAKSKRKGRSNSNSNGNNNNKRKKSRSPDHQRSNGQQKCHVVTLPLLPESPDLVSPRNDQGRRSSSFPTATWLSFGPSDGHHDDQEDRTVVVCSSVVVEGVTDTWLDVNGLGCTDEVMMKRRLDEDTCPGFVSDGWNRVTWTNEAYRKMVVGDTWQNVERSSVVVVVRLGFRETVELPKEGSLFPAFTCRVRVQYGSHATMTVPCDVWRLNGGGFAWRLDVKAALSLGRYLRLEES